VTRIRSVSPGPATLPLVLGMALLIGGAVALDSRTRLQRRRLHRHPDDAPVTAKRTLPGPRAVTGNAVTINRSRNEVYGFWRDVSNLPRFMENVRSVETEADGRGRWRIAGPAGTTVELVTEITEDREGELLAWRTVEGSDVEASGSVTFSDAPGGRGTIVRAQVAYLPPGGEIGRWIAKAFQREPKLQGRRELKRLKMLMETGEIATSANRRDAA
jgi:uncharacterized membrane protein